MKVFNVLTRKLKEKVGFTLSETLITVLILLMVSAIVAGGVPAAANAYFKVIDAANAQLLLSETVMKLRSELAVAADVEEANTTGSAGGGSAGGTSAGTDGLITYTSGESGWKKTLKNTDNGLSISETSDTDAHSRNNYLLTPGKMSGTIENRKALVTSCDSITYNNGIFTVTNLKVTKGGTVLGIISSMTIQNLVPKFSD